MLTFTTDSDLVQMALPVEELIALNENEEHPYYDCVEFGEYSFRHIEDIAEEEIPFTILAIDDNSICIGWE